MLRYKIDVMKELSRRRYTVGYLRKEKILSQETIQNLRNKNNVSINTLNILCIMLNCQPSDILEEVPSEEEKLKYLSESEKIIFQFLSEINEPITFEELCCKLPNEPDAVDLWCDLNRLEERQLIICDRDLDIYEYRLNTVNPNPD